MNEHNVSFKTRVTLIILANILLVTIILVRSYLKKTDDFFLNGAVAIVIVANIIVFFQWLMRKNK